MDGQGSNQNPNRHHSPQVKLGSFLPAPPRAKYSAQRGLWGGGHTQSALGEGQWGDTSEEHLCTMIWHQTTGQTKSIHREHPCSNTVTPEAVALREGQAQQDQPM